MRFLPAVVLLLLASSATAQERDDAIAAYAGAFRGVCDWDFGSGTPSQFTPDVYELTYTVSWAPEDPPREMRVYRFFCSQGAYNTGHVYLTANDDDGVRIAFFAAPTFDIAYEPAATGRAADEVVRSIQITGMGTQPVLINSEFDPGTGTITSYSHWRGIGDASTIGTWTLIDGGYSLQTYDLDASYDGSVDHIRVFEMGQTFPGH